MNRSIRSVLILALVAAFLAAPRAARAQAPIDGRWEGSIKIQGIELRIIVALKSSAGSLSGTIDIPQQGAAGLPLAGVRRNGNAVHFELNAGPAVAVFDGELGGDTISGTFAQGPATGTFSMARGAAAAPAAPAPPSPYVVEDVQFSSGAVTLAGTLTRPKTAGRVAAVVLLSGSGAQNRDEEVFGFKVFGVLADHLTRQGLAVLRTDDRGVGGSTGSTADATSEDLAGDALAAVAYLKGRSEIDAARIGLMGHSEGGIVAPMAAARSADVAFIVLLAGPALTGEQVMLAQAAAIARAQGAPEPAIEKNAALQRRIFAAVRAGGGLADLRAQLKQEGLAQIQALPAEQRKTIPDPAAYVDRALDAQLKLVESRWFRFFLDYDPAPALQKVRCPVLALFGELDLQVVPLDANRSAMQAAFEKGGNSRSTVTVIPKANHLFQAAGTGSPAEYTMLKKEFAPGVLDTLTDWIRARTAAK